MVFQNAVVGITSAFIRILYSILFGVLLLFRLDRVVLMKGFERFDKGHKSYIGFLYLEHTLNNPILRVFSELLLEGQQKREAKEERAFRDKALPLELTMKEDWIDQSEESKCIILYYSTHPIAITCIYSIYIYIFFLCYIILFLYALCRQDLSSALSTGSEQVDGLLHTAAKPIPLSVHCIPVAGQEEQAERE